MADKDTGVVEYVRAALRGRLARAGDPEETGRAADYWRGYADGLAWVRDWVLPLPMPPSSSGYGDRASRLRDRWVAIWDVQEAADAPGRPSLGPPLRRLRAAVDAVLQDGGAGDGRAEILEAERDEARRDRDFWKRSYERLAAGAGDAG